MPSTTLVHAIHEVGYELMLGGARVTDNATVEIIKDTGKLLTISIPGGLLPVHLTVDPRGRRDWCDCWPGTRRKQEHQLKGRNETTEESGTLAIYVQPTFDAIAAHDSASRP